jgi:hypothetical protein
VSNDLAANFPNMARFLERCHAMPAYQRGLERGGPYQLGQRAKG